MGSQLSILNDSDHIWTCSVGNDEEATKIAGIAATSMAFAAAMVATAGAAAPVAGSLAANGVVSICGISTALVASVGSTVASIGGAMYVANVNAGIAIAMKATNLLAKESGFIRIDPGERHTWDRGYPINRWLQAECISFRSVKKENEDILETHTLYMRPIFTSSWPGGDMEHSIKHWLGRNGDKASKIETQHINLPKVTIQEICPI